MISSRNNGDEPRTDPCLVVGDGNSKARSMSDQPATCPLCGAILRQSRNLRRHLELLHFGNGKPSKSSVRVRHLKTERHRASQVLLDNRERAAATDLSALTSSRVDHLHMRPAESSDLQTVTPLSMVSSALGVSGVSSLGLPGDPLRLRSPSSPDFPSFLIVSQSSRKPDGPGGPVGSRGTVLLAGELQRRFHGPSEQRNLFFGRHGRHAELPATPAALSAVSLIHPRRFPPRGDATRRGDVLRHFAATGETYSPRRRYVEALSASVDRLRAHSRIPC